MTGDEIEQVVRRELSTWAMYRPRDEVIVHPIRSGLWFIGYQPARATSWHANIEGEIFYLLGIRLSLDLRGEGLGSQLYEAIERIATATGCRRIQQTPSGWTHTDETRMNYLMRRGWLEHSNGIEVYKDLVNACEK
jgi:GNAT superfamily N-acetyltransferase